MPRQRTAARRRPPSQSCCSWCGPSHHVLRGSRLTKYCSARARAPLPRCSRANAPRLRPGPAPRLAPVRPQAPSPALERYTAAAARGMDKTSGRQLPADDLHARARQLAAAAARLRSCADGMAAAWGRHADTVLAAPQARAAGESGEGLLPPTCRLCRSVRALHSCSAYPLATSQLPRLISAAHAQPQQAKRKRGLRAAAAAKPPTAARLAAGTAATAAAAAAGMMLTKPRQRSRVTSPP